MSKTWLLSSPSNFFPFCQIVHICSSLETWVQCWFSSEGSEIPI
jgi:hypothetical protein